MSRVLCRLTGSVSFYGAQTGSLSGTVEVHASTGVVATVAVLAGLEGAFTPSEDALATHAPRLLWTFEDVPPSGDVMFGHSDFIGDVSVEDSLESGAAWSITVPASTDSWARGVLGYEVDWGGPPPGPVPVQVDVIYRSTLGVDAPIRVLRDGITRQSKRRLPSRKSGNSHSLELAGLGPEGRWDNEVVTYQLDPNHGKTHGQMIRELALLAGIPASLIEVGASFGSARHRALDVTADDWRSVADEIAQAAAHRLCWLDGKLTVIPISTTADPEWVFTPDQICAEVDVEVNADANKPLCIKVSGEEPKEPDGDGNVRDIEVIATYEENFSVPRATFRVTCPVGAKVVTALTGGTMTFSEGPLGTMTSLVISETFRVGGCVVKERVRTFGYHNPEVWRYQQDTTGAPKVTYAYNPLAGGVYLFDDAETDGAVGRAFEWAVFSQISESVTEYVFTANELTQKREYDHGWYSIKEAVTDADGVFLLDAKIGGGGAGLTGEFYLGPAIDPYTGEVWSTLAYTWSNASTPYLVGSSTHGTSGRWTNLVNSGGYLRQENSFSWKPSRLGTGYIYSDGYNGERYETYGEFAHLESRVVTHSARGDKYSRITVDVDEAGVAKAKVEKGIGYLPAATRCDPADNARSSGRQWCLMVCATGVYATGRQQEVSNDFIEVEAEGAALATSMLRDIHAAEVPFKVPANAVVRKGMPVALVYPEAGIIHRGWIASWKHSRGSGKNDPILTDVTVKLVIV